jgi:hypothetical protein
MAITYKVLGQVQPAATTPTTLYTTPPYISTVCSTLTICNLGLATTYRVAIRPSGEALAAKHYIIYNSTINQYDTVFLTIGASLSTTDVVTVYAGTSDVSFSLFGSEID